MYQKTEEKIIRPKSLIDPYQILRELNEAATANEHKYFRVFNTRSGKDKFIMHKGSCKYLYRDPKFIQCLDTEDAINTLFKLNNIVKQSNYLDFQILPECDTDHTI